MSEIDRVKWRCRRGLLELDLVLSRFFENCYSTLNEAEKTTFKLLLEHSDDELWSLLAARTQASDADIALLVERIRTKRVDRV